MMLKINNLTLNRKFHLCLIDVSGCSYVVLQVRAKLIFYLLLYYDKIYLYVKNLQQSKYQHLIDLVGPISKEADYPVIEAL